MIIALNTLITSNIAIFPFLIDLLSGKKDIKRANICANIRRYIFMAFVCNVFDILLFSFYKSSSAGVAMFYLIENLNFKYIAVANGINIFFLIIFKKIKMLVRFSLISQKYLIFSFLLTLFFINISLKWNEVYSAISFDQLIFHIKSPIKGVNLSIIRNFIVMPLIDTIFAGSLVILILSIKIYIKSYAIYIPICRIKVVIPYLAILFPFAGILILAITLDVPRYFNALNDSPSTFYEKYYINPADVNITFPQKRNLIVIFIESLETGFLTVEDGGKFTESLMPEIRHLAEENINFSQNDGIGGSIQLNGTGWTIAGIVSQYSGVPLTIPFTQANDYGMLGDKFMPNTYGLGDILNKEGYKNYFILGSESEFGGRDKYFKTHGKTIIYDYNYFHDNNFIQKGYKVWWGFEDRKLYQFAKDKLLEISMSPPFFLTLLTVDTHPDDGYLDEKAENIFDLQYKNVLRDMSKQLYEFVLWLKEQDFFENTTVVILGDHLYMDSSIFLENHEDKRYPINIFLNSLLDDTETKNRRFSSFDIFPTLVDSIGGIYNSDGLALGRSMSSGVLTLLETLGLNNVQDNLNKKSYLYNTLWGEGVK
jgi:phosphoglycerol transferase